MSTRFAKRMIMGALANGLAVDLARKRLSNDHAVVLMYHEVVEDSADIESWTAIKVSDLKRQLDYLGRHYDIVSMDDALARLRKPGGAQRPAAVVTFDDGGKGNATTLLPLIDAVKVPVTIYVATGHIETQQPYWFDRLINALQVESEFSVDLRRFDGLDDYIFNRVQNELDWAKAMGVTAHWLRHTTLTWVERRFGIGVARAYAGHADSGSDLTTTTYVKADITEVANALSALTGEPHPLAPA